MLQRFQGIRETDMKKLILITGVFLSSSLWADMDKVCYIAIENHGFFKKNRLALKGV